MKSLNGDLQMSLLSHPMRKGRQRGQTIIVAMVILGLLLILGFVFLGIINHSIKTSGFVRNRSIASDLSEAGIRYGHEQLLRSVQGADWRGQPTPPVDWDTVNPIETTRDPDALFLRPPATVSGAQAPWPGGGYVDRGGPDGLGPFFRVPFTGGRALVRISYGPSDADVFRSRPTGALRHPGAVRNYILIESIGREGTVSANDPTRLLNSTPRRIANYGSQAQFLSELNAMKQDQVRLGGLQVNRAFASIGIIESSRFITNKDQVSRPAEIGTSNDFGGFYRNGPVADLPMQMGTALPLLSFDSNNATSPSPVPLGGSMWVNGDVQLHGRVLANLNLTLGDEFDVAGSISGDDSSRLTLQVSGWNGTAWGSNQAILAPGEFASQSPNFDGHLVLRDGSSDRDAEGFPRSIGRKVPPSAFDIDPENRTNRYYEMTRDSGVLNASGVNAGVYGHGSGVYVGNSLDRQMASDEVSRAAQGGSSSLINDWLNPGNGQRNSGWVGYQYIPLGAYLQFQPDGFQITLNGQDASQRTWKRPDGTDTGDSTLRYKVGRGTDNRLHIINSLLVPNISSSSLGQSDYQLGPEFNGVLYFEGNVRVRGVIPTDIQVTVVSGATVYVEGSITKGVTGNHWTSTYSSARDSIAPTAIDQRLTRPSKSMLMLIAKDYVAVNTTQFFGVGTGQKPEPQPDVPNLPSYNPLLMKSDDTAGLTMMSEFALGPVDPTNLAQASNPSLWKSYATQYKTSAASATPNSPIQTKLLLVHSMADGAGEAFFLSLGINVTDRTNAASYYKFPSAPTVADAQPWVLPYPAGNNANGPYANAYLAPSGQPAGTFLPLYGLGSENYQRFGKFESITLPLIESTDTETAGAITSGGNKGSYQLSAGGTNLFTFLSNSQAGFTLNDYVLGRLAIAPHDIRIEASMFAENGSFFVIPGPWFNPNPNDNYNNWLNKADSGGGVGTDPAAGNLWRLETFGSTPNMPFYGEPLDVRIVISGSVSENMPPTAAQQAEWVRKWGWIPKRQGAATDDTIPAQHIPDYPAGDPLISAPYVPNIIIGYDPVLATGRRFGFFDPTSASLANLNDPGTYVRTRWIDYNMDGIQQISELVPLPPLPRLPVSPALAYFGEVH